MPEPRDAARPESTTAAATADASHALDGETFARMLAGGTAALTEQAAALNAINVFPVPDGDTGTNMSSTMRATVDAIGDQRSSAHAVAKAAAHGALMGAKGNSGVILSQIIGGFASALADRDVLDARALANAFERGQQAAYYVVSAPREGTILTGITAVALAADHAAHDGSPNDVLAAAVEAALGAAERTPDLMPLLKEAGVVDAGAQGLYVMLDGMLRALRGEDLAPVHDLGSIDANWLAARARLHEDGMHAGFCTEFVVEGGAVDADALREQLASMGESLLVIGEGATARVHIHTLSPGDVLAHARTHGAISHEKIDDMEAQFASIADAALTPQPPLPHGERVSLATGVAIIVVAAGAGIEELFRSLGAAAIIAGGQTMNPSAGDIRAAIERTGAREAIILPNNKNIVLAARQAVDGLSPQAHVIASTSIPQGVAALIAANPEGTLDANLAAMGEAIAAVRSGEVTLAARATRIGGIGVEEGQPIALVEEELIAACETVEQAARAAVARMVEGRDGGIVTLYAGEGVTPEAAATLAQTLRTEFAVDVEVVDGGQPHYPYLIGVE